VSRFCTTLTIRRMLNSPVSSVSGSGRSLSAESGLGLPQPASSIPAPALLPIGGRRSGAGRVRERDGGDGLPIAALEPVPLERHMVDGEWTGRYLA
jgi:hypothetical protein